MTTGATLRIGSAAGIAASGASGNVQTPTRDFSTAANYIYNGTAAQIAGSGLPSTVNSLTVNNSSGVTLSNNITVNNALTLTSGLLTLAGNNLTIAPSGSVSGGSSSSYIRTNGAGVFSRTVPASTETPFPIGNSAYNPAILTRDGGNNVFGVRVLDAVYANGLSGAEITDKVVRRTWDVTGTITSGFLDLKLQWNLAEESGFDRTLCYVSHYIGGAWDASLGGIAGGSNPYTQTRIGITSLSPFAVASSGALPIELLFFRGEKVQNAALLTWRTATELNNDYMAVERSTDGRQWEELGRVRGAGTTSTPQDYSFTDEKPLPGINYYRLRQVDYDGAFEYHDVIALEFNAGSAKPSMLLFPNPAREGITLRLSQAMAYDSDVLILDNRGRVLQRRTLPAGAAQWEFDLGGLPAGMYFLRISGAGHQEVLRFVKE